MSEIFDLLGEHREVWFLLAVALLVGAVAGALLVRAMLRGPATKSFFAGGAEPTSYLRGVNYILSNDTDAAIEELTKAAEVDGETVETYFALGALFRTKGEV